MKNIFFAKNLLNLLKKIYSKNIEFTDKTQERKFYESIAYYIYFATNINLYQKIIEIIKTIETHRSKDFVSIAEGLLRKGRN